MKYLHDLHFTDEAGITAQLIRRPSAAHGPFQQGLPWLWTRSQPEKTQAMAQVVVLQHELEVVQDFLYLG